MYITQQAALQAQLAADEALSQRRSSDGKSSSSKANAKSSSSSKKRRRDETHAADDDHDAAEEDAFIAAVQKRRDQKLQVPTRCFVSRCVALRRIDRVLGIQVVVMLRLLLPGRVLRMQTHAHILCPLLVAYGASARSGANRIRMWKSSASEIIIRSTLRSTECLI